MRDRPVTAPPPPPPPRRSGGGSGSAEAATTFEALKRWATEGMVVDPASYGELKDFMLRHIAKSGRRGADEIARMLPPAARVHAGAIARILAGGEAPVPGQAEPDQQSPGSARTAAPTGLQQPADGSTAGPEPTADETRGEPDVPTAGVSGASGPADDEDEAEPDAGDLRAEDFAALDFTETTGEPGRLAVEEDAAGSTTVAWAPAAGTIAVTLYRLVTGDDVPPYAPERGALVGITRECRLADPRPAAGAVRYYQVWRNEGPDVASALRSQPRLHAAAARVSPVSGLTIKEDHGRVVGTWERRRGIRQVLVYRVPADRVVPPGALRSFQITTSDADLDGFVDREAEPGRRYRYLVEAVAEVDGVPTSGPMRAVELAVPAPLDRVTDLAVVTKDGIAGAQLDLAWTPPRAGRVVVYRTADGPRAGADAAPRPEAVLADMGLASSDQLPDPVARDSDGAARMRGVPWPAGLARVYLTPVTLLDGMASVGATREVTRVPALRDPVIVERVHHQYVTFGWPGSGLGPGGGADGAVRAYIGAPGQAFDRLRGAAACEISSAQYREQGRLLLPRLPAAGCVVHLVPVAFAGGIVEGEPASVTYGGLLRLSYVVHRRRSFGGRRTAVMVTLRSGDVSLPGPPPFTGVPPFVLVNHPERLPLDAGDGDLLHVVQDDDERREPQTVFRPSSVPADRDSPAWRVVDVRGRRGFLRLFVNLPAESLRHVALVDPPVRHLRLDPADGR